MTDFLAVPPGEALADLDRQLAEGSQLLATATPRSAQEFEDHRGRCERWREATAERLRRMFGRPDQARRFTAAAAPYRVFAWPAGGFFGGSTLTKQEDEFQRLCAGVRRGCRMLEGLRDRVRAASP